MDAEETVGRESPLEPAQGPTNEVLLGACVQSQVVVRRRDPFDLGRVEDEFAAARA